MRRGRKPPSRPHGAPRRATNSSRPSPQNKKKYPIKTLIASAAALIGAAVWGGVNRDKPEPERPTPTLVSGDPKIIDAGTDQTRSEVSNVFRPKHPLPEFTFSNAGSYGKEMPEGLKMDEAIFNDATERFLYIMQTEGFTKMLIPQLKETPGEKNTILHHFAEQIPGVLEKQHPAIATHFREYEKQFGRKLTIAEAVQFVNYYLITTGNLLVYGEKETGMQFDLHPIKDFTFADIKDQELGDMQIPIIHLGRGMIESEESHRTGKPIINQLLGTYDGVSEFVIYFKDELNVAATLQSERFSEQIGVKVHFGKNEYLDDILRHESTHAALHRKFKKVHEDEIVGKAYEVPLEIPLGHGFANFSGTYPPVMFQELCGVGIQMAKTEIESPYILAQYLTDELKPDGYFLVNRLMPMALLNVGPENSLKEKIKNDLMPHLEPGRHQTGVENKDLLAYIGTFNQKQIRAAGRYLFDQGMELMRRAEQGEFRVIDKPQN